MTTQSSPPILASTLYRLYSHSHAAAVTGATSENAHSGSLQSKGKNAKPQWTAVPDLFASNHFRDDGYESLAEARTAKRRRADSSLVDDPVVNSAAAPERPIDVPKLKTGLERIDDDVLHGGLSYGLSTDDGLRTQSDGLVGLALPNNDPGCEIVPLSFIAEHLLNSENGKVYYIDADTAVSGVKLQRLHSLLCERLKQRRKHESERPRHGGGFVYSRSHEVGDQVTQDTRVDEEQRVNGKADEMLERVEWMRVLDFEGLTEAVGEVSGSLRRPLSSTGRGSHAQQRTDGLEVGHAKDSEHREDTDVMDTTTDGEHDPPVNRREVADSEDEEEEFAGSPELANNDSTASNEIANRLSPIGTSKPDHITTTKTSKQSPGPTLIITSPLPKLITPLMKRNHVSGHVLLSNFLRSLRHLVQECEGVIVVLCNSVVHPHLNPAVGSTSSSTKHVKQEEPSAFMDITARPALGRTFNWALDLSLMATRFPGEVSNQRKDGLEEEEVSRSRDVANHPRESEAEKSVVLEVLHDRLSDRTGRWGIFVPERGK